MAGGAEGEEEGRSTFPGGDLRIRKKKAGVARRGDITPVEDKDLDEPNMLYGITFNVPGPTAEEQEERERDKVGGRHDPKERL